MPLAKDTLLQGGRYKIVRHISNGGFGITYEAEHVLLHKRLAVKEFFVKDFCNRDETTNHVTVGTKENVQTVSKLRKKFLEEVAAVSLLSHPNIVKMSDVFEENGTAYYVMDYINGKSLHHLVNEEGTLPENTAVGYILQIADALKYLHSNNRLHLDIKPEHIIIDGYGKAILIMKLHVLEELEEAYWEFKREEMIEASPASCPYKPIESMGNCMEAYCPATDIYSLGATLYKQLSGITPPCSCEIAGEEAFLQPLPKHISVKTRKAVAAAMEVRVKNRPQSIDEFLCLLNSDAYDTP